MRIAIASGKGGTGKTTIATNLAVVAAAVGRRVVYADCDVEEPNGRIFLQPTIERELPIEKPVPLIDDARCVYCGRCAEACRFGAIASLPSTTVVHAELCHACGGCMLACPEDAIGEQPRAIGTLRVGRREAIGFVEGELTIGEAMSPPAIRAVKAALPPADLVLLDAPPGTSCPVVETIRDCDAVVLVTEPTPFGLHDLTLAVEMLRAIHGDSLRAGVVINRSGIGDGQVARYCAQQAIPVLAELPDDRAVAEAYSRGEVIAEAVPSFAKAIGRLLPRIDEGMRP
jgi:MinD superfamily P-loop ATPase